MVFQRLRGARRSLAPHIDRFERLAPGKRSGGKTAGPTAASRHNGEPGSGLAGASIDFPQPNLRTPYTMRFNFTVQRQIVNDTVLEVAYVGKLGRKLLEDISYNPAIYAPGATVANENSRVIYPGFGNLATMGTFAISEYNALQARATKRYSRNFMVMGTYTFSKSLDPFSGGAGASVTDTAATPNPFNVRGEWAPSDFYAKHIASAAIWDMPRLLHRNVLLRETAGGWNPAVRFTARSGNRSTRLPARTTH